MWSNYIRHLRISTFTSMNFRFPTSQKLKSRKAIELLFSEGKTINKFPIRVFFIPSEEIKVTQTVFAVPKRSFKSAVDRNRIKRQIREAYRLHKQLLITDAGKKYTLLFLYIGKNKLPYQEIEKSMILLLKKMIA